MNDIAILSVAICAVVLVFAVVFISYVYRRRHRRHVIGEKSSPFKPSYEVVTRPSTGSSSDLLGTCTGPGVSPVTPTEFFGADYMSHPVAHPRFKDTNRSMSSFDDFGEIDPAMYEIENADDSATQTPFLGEIKFSLLYDAFRNILRVTLMAAFNLARPEADDSKHLNPYVTLTLQPEYHHLLQSKVQQKTRAPIFNEKFEFEVMFSNLYSQTLWFTVFNFSSDSRHTVIGQAVLPLEDLQPSVEQIFSLDLKPTTERMQLGDILFSLGYLRIAGRLTLIVMKARNLPQASIKGTDAYVKVTLIQNGRRTKKKKTSTKKNQVNPVFNEAVSFDIASESLETTGILLTVIHENKIIGCVLVGGNTDGKELEHWKRMKVSDKPIAEWHALQDGRKFY